MELRRVILVDEELMVEGGRPVEPHGRKLAAIAVITNPFTGMHQQDLKELIDTGEQLGELLAKRIIQAVDARCIECFGKAAIVGERGELEHAAALIHPTYGKAVRRVIGGGAAIIPSTKKMGGPGISVDVPLHYKEAASVSSHYDAMEVRLPDSPKADEIVIVLAVTTGGRPHARIPGLKKEDAKGVDGVR
jgi:hypothetical protein